MSGRFDLGLAASGGVLFLASAAGLLPAWTLVVGALLLAVASVVIAVGLEARSVPHWQLTDDGWEREALALDGPQLDPAA